MNNIALITGITGQDGYYLTELLLGKNYKVHGIIRRTSTYNLTRLEPFINNGNLYLHYGDITDITSIITILNEIKKKPYDIIEIYNLAAQSHVKISFDIPIYSTHVDSVGTLNILEAIRQTDLIKSIKFYQASTSELYGEVISKPQNESTPFNPVSPYAISKLYSYWITKCYRKAYNMFICNGILFNHESKFRGENFVSRKITLGIAQIIKGKREYIELGNLNSLRDWGHAKDYVKAMWLMLQQTNPDDYVISSGEQHTLKEFIEKAFSLVGINIIWEYNGEYQQGICKKTNKVLVKVNPKYFRPNEVDDLLGDPTYAFNKLGWKCTISFDQLISEMVQNDISNT